jgi:hypothetical protein
MIDAILLVAVLASADCGQVRQYAVGGDYTSARDRRNLALVEAFHFTPDVEALKRGSVKPGENIATTLEHYPNHHRALAAMARLGQRDQAARVNGAAYTVDCYFQRAIRSTRLPTTTWESCSSCAASTRKRRYTRARRTRAVSRCRP